ncbi:hypothetical protein ES754_10325 [Psychrobacter frigidicola]|uniref:Uncharacterized protein n=1 Tax=Psychrobacter frigidicola TaxID=45611 RepID=A0A5C7A212_9GAMM|nr:hypothetical protein ES754_10325 [Psychrobacter frigidicola]
MPNTTYESVFQADIIDQMQTHGWQLGQASGYQRATALYEQDALKPPSRMSGISFAACFLSIVSAILLKHWLSSSIKRI